MTSKQRKLKYIREKNNLRLGGCMYFMIKSSNHIDSDTLIKCFEYETSKFRKKYKLNLKITEVTPGFDTDDFIKNQVSYRIKLKNYDKNRD